MSSLAVLTGHVVADLRRNSISTVVMLVVGLVIGFRSNASFTDWLAIVGIVLLFTLAFSCLSAIVGVLARSVEAVQWLTFFFVFPLTSPAPRSHDRLTRRSRVGARGQAIMPVLGRYLLTSPSAV